ncbi:hypothetical protein Tco_0461051 [Tanacetum coccineum]
MQLIGTFWNDLFTHTSATNSAQPQTQEVQTSDQHDEEECTKILTARSRFEFVVVEFIFDESNSKSVKRKLPYDSDLECESSGVSKKQNLRSNDAFGHATVVNVDNHISKSPMATYCLHGEPLVKIIRILGDKAKVNFPAKATPVLTTISIQAAYFLMPKLFDFVITRVKIPVMYITDHITKPTITITRALHIAKSLQIILILLLDDDTLMRWKEQLLRAVNINDAAVIIMAQQQHAADVHPDELCPPNKRYDLMDANKKVDLEHVQCPSESKILTNIIKNHPLRFSIAASSSVPWIYMAQFWHTLKEDGSKYRLRFMLDKKELSLTLDDFRTIFHLPQANDNNHNSFVPPPTFSDMVPFYKQQLGFTMKLKTSSSFKTTGLLQPWQTLCKIFSKCLTTRVTGWDQPPLQIMQMMYCFVNNIHVDYAELLWEGIYYSLHHPTSSIPYLRFTKIIASHYMTIFLEISRRARDISTRLTPPVPVPTVEKAHEMILQDTLHVSLAEHKSREEQEARKNVELVNKHLASEEIEKLVEGSENVIGDSSPPRNDEP